MVAAVILGVSVLHLRYENVLTSLAWTLERIHNIIMIYADREPV